MRRAALLLSALLLVASIPQRPSAAQDSARVRFPADVAARNDIVLENRVPIRMRDGVTLYADVYRPVGDGRYPVLLSITPYIPSRRR